MSSSQGAAVGSGTNPSQIPKGPTFSQVSLRDSSDWIRYKKEVRVYNDNKNGVNIPSISPWLPFGNDFRLTYLNGQFKQPNSGSCTECGGPDFSTNGVPISCITDSLTIDFSTGTCTGGSNSKYKIYTLQSPTTEITFTLANIPSGTWNVEIDHASFDFESDGSSLDINGSGVSVSFDGPNFSNFCIYADSDNVTSGDTVTLYTNTPISGQLYVGIYP